MWKCRKFSHLFCQVLMWSPPKKKGYCTDGGIFFSDFMLISEKKKGLSSEFCKFSLRFVRHSRARRREPQLSTVFGGKQKRWFLAGEKTPEFAKFQCEKVGKNFALFCAYWEHWPQPSTRQPSVLTTTLSGLRICCVKVSYLNQKSNQWKKSNTGIIRCRCSSDLMSETGPVI